MKLVPLAVGVLVPCVLACSKSTPAQAPQPPHPDSTQTAPVADQMPAPAAPAGEPITILYDGLGDLHHPVTTASPQAQQFFDQGLRLIYAFNHPEAIRSFHEAARLDPGCAMAYWGVAIALGPNYNMPSDPDGEKTAREMIEKARALEATVTPVEREYIEAAAMRYAGPVTPDRKDNDRAYAAAMQKLAKGHPDDVDAAVLYAESLMDLDPWKLWNRDGSPTANTGEILTTLEGALAKHPDHPGANHYYIHAQEAGPHPEKALEAAKRLPTLMPGAGHIVHMPCHIFIHTGMWAEASEANEQAIAADKAYLAKPHAEGIYTMMYVGHNYQFLWFTAGMEGRGARSLEAARDMVTAMGGPEMIAEMEKSMPGVDYFLAPPLFAMVRFGMWDKILAEPAPPAEFRNLAAVRQFARAFALARTGKLKEARAEQAQLEKFYAGLADDEMLGPLNSAKAIFGVATKLLAGEIEATAGHRTKALALERQAVAAEDALSYDEPPPWPLATRHYLGALLLEANKPADAIAVYQADLKRYPENGWALLGLEQAYTRRKSPEARAVHERLAKVWKRADVHPKSSRF